MIDISTLFSTGLTPVSWENTLLCMVLAFILGRVIAATYRFAVPEVRGGDPTDAAAHCSAAWLLTRGFEPCRAL